MELAIYIGSRKHFEKPSHVCSGERLVSKYHLLSFTQKEPADRPKEAIDDLIPDKIYSKEAIVEYLQQSREKCKGLIESLTEEKLQERFTEGNEPHDMDYPILEILLYNLRHTQHHVAQLNMLIRQDLDKHMEWSFRAGDINMEK